MFTPEFKSNTEIGFRRPVRGITLLAFKLYVIFLKSNVRENCQLTATKFELRFYIEECVLNVYYVSQVQSAWKLLIDRNKIRVVFLPYIEECALNVLEAN